MCIDLLLEALLSELWLFWFLFLARRAAIEYEKKGYAENYEHGQVLENKLVSMARELEKLRAEMANAEKRARAAAAVGNQGIYSSSLFFFLQMNGIFFIVIDGWI